MFFPIQNNTFLFSFCSCWDLIFLDILLKASNVFSIRWKSTLEVHFKCTFGVLFLYTFLCMLFYIHFMYTFLTDTLSF